MIGLLILLMVISFICLIIIFGTYIDGVRFAINCNPDRSSVGDAVLSTGAPLVLIICVLIFLLIKSHL